MSRSWWDKRVERDRLKVLSEKPDAGGAVKLGGLAGFVKPGVSSARLTAEAYEAAIADLKKKAYRTDDYLTSLSAVWGKPMYGPGVMAIGGGGSGGGSRIVSKRIIDIGWDRVISLANEMRLGLVERAVSNRVQIESERNAIHCWDGGANLVLDFRHTISMSGMGIAVSPPGGKDRQRRKMIEEVLRNMENYFRYGHSQFVGYDGFVPNNEQCSKDRLELLHVGPPVIRDVTDPSYDGVTEEFSILCTLRVSRAVKDLVVNLSEDVGQHLFNLLDAAVVNPGLSVSDDEVAAVGVLAEELGYEGWKPSYASMVVPVAPLPVVGVPLKTVPTWSISKDKIFGKSGKPRNFAAMAPVKLRTLCAAAGVIDPPSHNRSLLVAHLENFAANW